MQLTISQQNVLLFIRQEYGLNASQCAEILQESSKQKRKIINHVIQEFTGFTATEHSVSIKDNYSGKTIQLDDLNVYDIFSMRKLLAELSDYHKAKIVILQKSRKDILRKQALAQSKLAKDQEQTPEIEQG